MLKEPYPARLKEESGQMLVLMIGIMTIVFALGAITVDIGLWLSERRGAQSDADLIALAGAVELKLGGSEADALAAANDSLTKNDQQGNLSFVQGSPTITSTCVTADVRHDSKPLFFTIFGFLDEPDISAHAKACIESESTIDIFTYDSTCPTNSGITINGNAADISATMHSNSDVIISGNDHEVTGTVEYACDFTDTGNNNQITGGPFSAEVLDWPIYFERADFDCSGPNYFHVTQAINESTPGVWQDVSTGTLRPGIYCSDPGVDIRITRDAGVNGNVTLVSGGKINLQSNSVNLADYANGVVLFAESTATDAIRFSGNSATFTGIIFTEGGINMTGNVLEFNDGGILGGTLSITSNGDVAFYESVIQGDVTIALVE